MTSPATAESLDRAVEDYRMRFEVARETVREGERRRTVGLEVRLWATLPEGQHHLPDGPECRDAVRTALRVVEAAASPQELPGAEVEPFHRALYESRLSPGRDEVYVAIRPPLPYGTEDADQVREASLVQLKRRLVALGVFEGRWRPKRHEDETWQVRPLHEALSPASEPARPEQRLVMPTVPATSAA
jgi:hypothetical protein